MRSILRTITKILDGTPSHIQVNRQGGQSLLEMALITPLLFIMVVGIVEIGWFANNYLTLLEVTRIGARTGTVLVGDLSPLEWDDGSSLHKTVLYHMGIQEYAGIENGDPVPDPAPARDSRYTLSEYARNCEISAGSGFYKFIACSMVDSLEPLSIKTGTYTVRTANNVTEEVPYVDDIVISVFSLQAVNNDNPALWVDDPIIYSRTFDFDLDSDAAGKFPDGPSVIVVGRYPTNANECNVWLSGGVETRIDGRYPFDFYDYGVQNRTRPIDGVVRDIEIFSEDDEREFQRGFVWTGQYQHPIDETSEDPQLICWGSNFSIEDVEELMNANNFVPDGGTLTDTERRRFLPSQGLVLVEMMWNHELLLDFPFFPTLVQMFGDTQRVVITVWAAFPAPTVEPNIVFDLN